MLVAVGRSRWKEIDGAVVYACMYTALGLAWFVGDMGKCIYKSEIMRNCNT